jgi:molybdopterin-guanine dinucleotide biosynthesis protein A
VICFVDKTNLRHPFPGLYHRSCYETLQRGMQPGSMQRFLDTMSVRVLSPRDLPSDWDLDRILHNVNRPEDLDE